MKNMFITDISSDGIAFTPPFWITNLSLQSNGVSEGLAGAGATSIAITTYFLTFCAMYEHAPKINDRVKMEWNSTKKVLTNPLMALENAKKYWLG